MDRNADGRVPGSGQDGPGQMADRRWNGSQEDLYRVFAEAGNHLVWALDISHTTMYVSPAIEDLLGWTREEYLQLPPEGILAPESMIRARTIHAELLADSSAKGWRSYEALHIHKDATLVPGIVTVSLLVDLDGKIRGFMGSTRRGQLEAAGSKDESSNGLDEEMLRANRLEAIGILAGGVAHDFNNLLAAIMGNISLATLELDDLFKEDTEQSPTIIETRRLLGEAEKASLRARDLTRQLLMLSKGGSVAKTAVDPADLATEVSSFQTPNLGTRIELEVGPSLPWILGDRSQIFQLAQNLIINAAQAMPRGGLVRVRLHRAEGPESPGPGVWVRFEVEDEGKGIPPDVRDRLFEPWFTTRKEGSGLGLAICQAVVRKHGGTISAGDGSRGGALFRVFLPAIPPRSPEALALGVKIESKPGRRILLIDDQKGIRDLAHDMAARAGYLLVAVASVPEGEAEWERNRSRNSRAELVIIDWKLGGGSLGTDFLVSMKEHDPGPVILVSSGYLEGDPVDPESHGYGTVLRKPFNYEDFIQAVELAFPG
ncbi:MAG: ATP-binding protein [Rectinemataceae bacterium]